MIGLTHGSMTKFILVLTPLVLLMPFGLDLYVPSIPLIGNDLGASTQEMQMTLSGFLACFAFSQLFFGPISDAYGRVKIAFVGGGLFIFGSALAMFSTSFEMFFLGRIIQAAGACAGYVVTFAIIRDCYPGDSSAPMYSYINGIIAFSPILAPALGTALDIHFGWHSGFLFLTALGVLSIISVKYYYKETLNKSDRLPVNIKVFKRYISFLKKPSFILYALSSGTGISYLFVFASISPIVLLEILHLPKETFGLYFSFMGVSYMIGSFIGGKLSQSLSVRSMLILGHSIAVLGGVFSLIWHHYYGLSALGFVIPMLPIGIGGTLCLGASTSGALEPFPKSAASATAMFGLIQSLTAASVGAIVVSLGVTSSLPIGYTAVLMSSTMLILFLLLNAVTDSGDINQVNESNEVLMKGNR
jgi:DHA1 family bicyclomycin/chloramphenicol resistance-like MFS transporter